MPYYGENIGVIPLTDARGVTKTFNYSSHKGLDIGWSEYVWINCPVLAWQDGIVIDKGYSSEVGNFLVVEHVYSTGKRWTAYIHLAEFVTLAKNSTVTLGVPMGNAKRGNTGNSSGVHLHLYMTKILPMNTIYTWNTMLVNCIDPYPNLYFSPKYNINYIAPSWKKELIEMKYPTPVERNESVHQVEIKSDTRRLRDKPSLSGGIYESYCTRGIYNVYEWSNADGYDWALIDTIDNHKFYVAVMDGENLPVTDYKKLYEEEKNKRIKAEENLKNALEKLEKIKQIVI